MDWWNQWVVPSRFMPHGHCYLWEPPLVVLHAGSDLLTFAAYLTIPFVLARIARSRGDLPFRGLFLAFVLFIACCGLTHLCEAITLWTPAYWISGLAKAATALVSTVTAASLIINLPGILAIPTQEALIEAHRQRAESDRRARAAATDQERLARLVEASQDAIVSLGAGGSVQSWNRGAEALFGVRAADVLGRSFEAVAELDETAREVLRVALHGQDSATAEVHVGAVPASLRASPLRGADGAVDGAVVILRDLTDSRQARELERSLATRELLLREIHHRVKNNLQVVSSLLAMSSREVRRGAVTPERAFAESQARLRAIGLIHEQLYGLPEIAGVRAPSYLGQLVPRVLATGSSEGIELSLDVAAVDLPLDQAMPIGLIVTEFVSNALRHGLADGRGTLGVSLRQEGEELVLAVHDSGPAFADDAVAGRPGHLGWLLVDNLAQQLGGRWETRTDPRKEVVVRWPAGNAP